MSHASNTDKFIIYSDNLWLASSLNRYISNTQPKKLNISVESVYKNTSDGSAPIAINEMVESDGLSEEVFQDHLGTLFPEYLITDSEAGVDNIIRSCSYFPRIFSDIISNDFKTHLINIYDICEYYKNFKQIVLECFNEKKYTVKWNDFNLGINNSETTILLFNIQSGSEKLWEGLYNKFFNLSNELKAFFIFYYYDDNDKELKVSQLRKDSFENEDKLFGYSRFIRDFLKEKGIGFELQVKIDQDILTREINIIEHRIDVFENRVFKPKTYFDKQIQLIDFTLRSVYGRNFPLKFKNNDENKNRIPQLYIYNKNSYASKLEDLQKLLFSFNRQGNSLKSISSHGLLNEYEEHIGKYPHRNNNNDNYLQEGGVIQYWNHYRKTNSALLRSFIHYKKFNKRQAPKFLFIDDNIKPLIPKLHILKKWFQNSEIYYTSEFKWKDFIKSNKLINAEIKIVNIKNDVVQTKKISEINPDFLVIDLDYKGQLVGIDILRKLRCEIKNINSKVINLIVLSRYEEPYIIRTAVNNGALLYITKSNFLRLIYKIFQLNFNYKEHQRRYHNYENWHLLSKLDPSKVSRLKYEMIDGTEYDTEKNDWKKDFKYSDSYQWLNKLPKADLHCHIGSCIGPTLLPVTASIVLSQLYRQNRKYKNNIELIIEYLIPFVLDPNLNESNHTINNPAIVRQFKESLAGICNSAVNNNSIFQIMTNYLQVNMYEKSPEEVMLSPQDTTLERILYNGKNTIPPFLINKLKLRERGITYAEMMLSFILLLHVRDKYNLLSYTYSDSVIGEITKYINKIGDIYPDKDIKELKSDIKIFLKEYYSVLRKILINNNNIDIIHDYTAQNIIQFLQSARSERRCLGKGGGSLFSYLRGCEYGGAEHLQTKASIYLTTYFIVHEYALKNNIRYLELRCAVDGYSKMNLQTQEEAIESLLYGFDHYTKKEKVKVNLILTAKRHKSEKEFEHNLHLARKYRYGLALNRENYTNGIEKQKCDSYIKDYPTRVVSFDLAGLEKGNRPSKFYQQFLTLLRECFPITIHAGEEDTYESIWEAIYLVHSQRLGHGLTLRENPDLLEAVRERHITVELCPLSNFMTRRIEDKYLFGHNESIKDTNIINDPKTYPLRQYLDYNIDVTINSDNPYVNDAYINEEYLFAARLIGGLTRWEILRLIKNSFKGAAIPKDEKRKLMNEIDDELYEIIQNEG